MKVMGEHSPYSKIMDREHAWLLYGKCVSNIVLWCCQEPSERISPFVWEDAITAGGGKREVGLRGRAEKEARSSREGRGAWSSYVPPVNYPGGPSNGSFMVWGT